MGRALLRSSRHRERSLSLESTRGETPKPVVVFGLVGSLEIIVGVSSLSPAAVGANVTLTMQIPLAAGGC